MPKENAKAQLRALYAAEGRKEGRGIVDDISSAIYAAYNEVADMDSASWKKVKSIGDLDSEFWVTQHLPTEAQSYLDKHGDEEIKQVIIRKAPVVKALETALELFSIGKWEKAKADMGYDTMFHLSLILNKNTILEKLARINIGTVDSPPYPEFSVVDVKGKVTLKELVEKTKKHMGDKFYPYDPFYNNCQDFVNAVLVANRDVLDYDKSDKSFVKQSMDTMIRDLPSYLPSFARTITSLGGLTGGALPIGQDVVWEVANSAYKKGDGSKKDLGGGITLAEKTDGLVLYVDGDNTAFVGVRGTRPTDTDDLYADSLIPRNMLGTSPRYERDSGILRGWRKKYPQYTEWFGIGHSLGGALVDEMIRMGLVEEGFSFNPAIQPRDFTNPKHIRLYKEGDPMYDLFGQHDPNAVVLPRDEEGWLYWVWRHTLTGKLYDYLISHKLAAFGDLTGGAQDGMTDLQSFKTPHVRNPEGQGADVGLEGAGRPDIDVEALFASLEDLVGGAFAPTRPYEVAEERDLNERARPREMIRKSKDIEQGLRALAHKYDVSDDPIVQLASFGARVMADDIYEHATGNAPDWGHASYATDALKRNFRNTRNLQVEGKREVDQTIAQYDLMGVERREARERGEAGVEEGVIARRARARAYRILYQGEAPPRAPAPVVKVKTAAEQRAEEEAEAARVAADVARREAAARRDAEEAARRAQAAEDFRRREVELERQRLLEAEAARRAQEEAARRNAEAEAAARRAQEEEARREAEARAEEARQQAELDATRRRQIEEAARLAAQALAQEDDFQVAVDESNALNAIDEQILTARRTISSSEASIAAKERRRERVLKENTEILGDIDDYSEIRATVVGVLVGGGTSKFDTFVSPPMSMKGLRRTLEVIEGLMAENPDFNYNTDNTELTEEERRGKEFSEVDVEIPRPGGFYERRSVVVPPGKYLRNVEFLRRAMDELRAKQAVDLEQAQRKLAVLVPELEGEIAGLRTTIERERATVADLERQKEALTAQFKERDKRRKELEKAAAKGEKGKKKKPKGGAQGTGQQHKPFPYEDPDADEDEKAKERARHYRQTLTLTRRWEPKVQYGRIKATIRERGQNESSSGRDFVKSIRETEKKRREVEKAEPEKKLAVRESNRLFEVEAKPDAPASYKAVLAARGPKVFPPKKTMPKEGSVRKPYVGKKMKEAFMEAVSGRGVKEQRNLFNRAKRLYKEGGKSWEEVITQVAG